MIERYDVVVVGGGAMGTAAAWALAERGREVIVLERFSVGHANGSSGGPTRIFRLAYDTPDYVRMARAALGAWRDLEAASGRSLLRVTGGIDLGLESRSAARALEAAGESFQYLDPAAVTERWPSLRLEPDAEVFVQEEAGVCRAADVVRAQARVATGAGATLIEHVTVDSIVPAPGGVDVRTDRGDAYRTPLVIVAAGAWAGPLLRTAGIDLPLTPSLEQVTYFDLDGSIPTVVDRTEGAAHPTYTVPDPWAPGSAKVGFHRSGPQVDAGARPFEPDPERVARTETYVAQRFAGGTLTGQTDTCLYTNTPDEDFLIDRVGPLVVVSPCSGHGFKFTPLIGRIAADLATGTPPAVPLERFRADRSSLRAARS